MKVRSLITGVFWDLGMHGFHGGEENYRMSRSQWERELDLIKRFGCDSIVFFGLGHAIGREATAAPDLAEFLFSECDRRELSIFVETRVGLDWYNTHNLTEEIEENKRLIRILKERFSHHPSFGGWYLGYECYVLWGERRTFYQKLLPVVTWLCRDALPKPVVISPFFMPDTGAACGDFRHGTPAEYEDYWNDILASSSVDVLALQDNGGQHLSFFEEVDTRPFITAFAKVCKNNGTALWGNVETGELPVADLDDFVRKYGFGTDVNARHIRHAWRGVPLERLQRKLSLMSEYSEKIVSWGYREFYRPTLGSEGERLYENYLEYARTVSSRMRKD